MPQDPSASVIASDAEPGTEPLSWQEVRQRFGHVARHVERDAAASP